MRTTRTIKRVVAGAATSATLVTALFVGTAPASAGSRPIGQLKSVYNGLCLSNGLGRVGSLATYQRCNTRSPGQYWSATGRLGGYWLESIHNLCLAVNNQGLQYTAGMSLHLEKCTPMKGSQVFLRSGGDNLPEYFAADRSDLRPSHFCAGTATRSVGTHVALSTCARARYQAWVGNILVVGG